MQQAQFSLQGNGWQRDLTPGLIGHGVNIVTTELPAFPSVTNYN